MIRSFLAVGLVALASSLATVDLRAQSSIPIPPGGFQSPELELVTMGIELGILTPVPDPTSPFGFKLQCNEAVLEFFKNMARTMIDDMNDDRSMKILELITGADEEQTADLKQCIESLDGSIQALREICLDLDALAALCM